MKSDAYKSSIINCDKCRNIGISYENERNENIDFAYSYKPYLVKLLWILESPPLSDPPRYFYRPELTKNDGLFREIMKVLNIPIFENKLKSLDKFKELGYFLIDSTKCPSDKNNSHLKPLMLNNCALLLLEEVKAINPENILIIKADIFDSVFSLLRQNGFEERVLNKKSIPFPGSGQQVRFRKTIEDIFKFKNNKGVINATIKIKPLASVLINNITESDIKSRQIRITINNKYIFPSEIIGQPNTYILKCIFDNTDYDCNYTIGSKDRKSRSGILKLGSDLCLKLALKSNDSIKIKIRKDKEYLIEKE